jgi:hypothetical protein
MPGPSEEDVPRWQPPPVAPSDSVPRWDPEREVPRWAPEPEVPRPSRRSAGATRARVDTETRVRRAPEEHTPTLAVPFVWWSRHPWLVAWACVVLVPAGVLLLRVVDESRFQRFVQPLEWALLGLLGLALLRGALFTARRSAARLTLGLLAALAAIAVLLWPMTRVTLGRVTCPARAGTDLGVPTAAVALRAWQRGETGEAAWHAGAPSAPWLERSRAIMLLDYQLVETGCFERIAPIDATRTWHDFRVTIREGQRAPLSKVLVVHTAAELDGWKITGIEGPLP